LKSDEAVKQVLENVGTIDDEEYLPVYTCKGRITTRPVHVKVSNPPFMCAAMDGYAVLFEKTRGADLSNPVNLDRKNDATPVNTGDLLPQGTNAVIMVEDAEEHSGHITVRKPVHLWQNVRMVGEDLIEGDMLLPSNHRITILDIGMIISADVTHVHVRRRPRIAIIPTGKELIDIFKESLEPRGEPRLIDFNSYTLKQLAEETGYEAFLWPIASSREELLKSVTDATGAHDVVLVNAGSSAGREDYTEEVVSQLGTLVFHGVSMMPGKPALFGVAHGKPIFGIPGYPVSAVVTFKTFLVPLYEQLMRIKTYTKSIACVTAYKMASRIGIEEIVRVNLMRNKGEYFAIPLSRGASAFSSLAKADGIVRIPEHIEGYEEGETVACELLRNEEEIAERIHIIGSHDLSLDVMRDIIKTDHPGMDLISTHTGSLSGILALAKGITPLATTHILDEQEKIYNVPAIKRYLPHKAVRLIHVAKRTQGLLIQKGNPRGIAGIRDLVRSDIRFVNRQVGSGTRILFDSLCSKQGLEKELISGYDREESSHTAVGVLIKESIADVGIGIYSVARAFSLDFIPLAEEEYDLLVTMEFASDGRFSVLMDVIASKAFRQRVDALGGYNTGQTGKIKYEQG